MYERLGFARTGLVLDDGTLEDLRRDLHALLGDEPESSGYGVLRHNVWERARSFELALPRLAGIALSLLRSDEVVLFQDNLIWKPPGTTRGIDWHQDFAYWPLEEPSGITLWVALDDADLENGCLRYVPGTHKEGECAPTNFVEGQDAPDARGLPLLRPEGREEVAMPARAGEVLAHHPLTWHVSGPNASARERRAWSLTWVLPHVRWNPGHAPHPYNFELAPRRDRSVGEEDFPRFARAQ